MNLVVHAADFHDAGMITTCLCCCRLDNFTQLMNREARNLVDVLRPAALDGSAVDVDPLVQQHMTQILGLAAFGCVMQRNGCMQLLGRPQACHPLRTTSTSICACITRTLQAELQA